MAKFHPVDAHVGLRVRQRRALLGLSQTDLGSFVGLAFQQIQKYERGSNRISSSRLYEFSRILDVPVTYFFEDMPASGTVRSRKRIADLGLPFAKQKDLLIKRETLELVRAYYKIRDNSVRKHIFGTVIALAGSDPLVPARSRKKR